MLLHFTNFTCTRATARQLHESAMQQTLEISENQYFVDDEFGIMGRLWSRSIRADSRHDELGI